jgi:hypothetical protein
MSRICGCCGKLLDQVPSDFAYRRPIHYFAVPEAERATRVKENDDLCVIDDQIHLIRGVMFVPIVDLPGQQFGWGFWAAVSPRSFARYMDLYDSDGSDEPRFRGLLAVSPPNYPDLLDAEVEVQLGPSTQRPTFHPTTFEHPLFQEYRDGITIERWHQIIAGIEEFQSRQRQ